MRRIDLRKLKIPINLENEAYQTQQRINAGVSETQAGYAVWSQLKPELKRLSNGKCWYCEAREDRSDNAVDHFRPKSIYPWFACDLENFRYSCTFCNSIRKNPDTGESSGKGNHFPLLEGKIARNAAERKKEKYTLLDPCKPTDVALLDFTDDGRPKPRYPEQEIRAKRATESIRYYHLNHPDLNEVRRQLALDIREWIDGGDAVYSKLDQGDSNTEKAFEVFYSNIARAIDKDAPFSVFSKKMVKGYQDRPWIEDLLESA